MNDRGPLEEFWTRWEALYRARPASDKKDFPFVGASNLVIPLIATDVDTLYARMMGLLFEPSNLWSVAAQRPELVDFAAATQEFFKWAQDNELKPYAPVGNYLLEKHKYGTGILKQRYVREMKKAYEWREQGQGTFEQQSIVMMKDHPSLSHVRLWDFYIPAGFPDLQQAPWAAERVRMTWMQFMNRVKAGLYTNADKVGAWFFNPPVNRVQQQMDSLSMYKASVNQQMEFYEFWVDFDIDGDGWDEALVCTIHLESQTYVRLDFNPFFNQEKPYSAGQFMRDPNSFYGIGLCEMGDAFQEGMTAYTNQHMDNGTVMLSQMWAVRKDNMDIKRDEPVYPGKIWRLNDPAKDIVAIPLGAGIGTAMSAAVELEGMLRQESQRRTGVNDWVAAQFQPSMGYGTAYTTQQMIAQSTKRFGETLRETRRVLSECGTRILELYQQFNPGGKAFVALGQREGQMVDAILHFPIDLIRKGLTVGVTAIDAEMGKDQQIRNITLMQQQLMQFYQNYMQMLSYLGNPQIPPQLQQVALVAAEGSAVMMRRLLALEGTLDYDRLIPDLQGGLNEQQQALANLQSVLQSAFMGSGGPQPGRPGLPPGTPGQQGIPGATQPNPTIYGPAPVGQSPQPGRYSGAVPSTGGFSNAR